MSDGTRWPDAVRFVWKPRAGAFANDALLVSLDLLNGTAVIRKDALSGEGDALTIIDDGPIVTTAFFEPGDVRYPEDLEKPERWKHAPIYDGGSTLLECLNEVATGWA